MGERRPCLVEDEHEHRQQQHDHAADQRAEPKLGALVLVHPVTSDFSEVVVYVAIR